MIARKKPTDEGEAQAHAGMGDAEREQHREIFRANYRRVCGALRRRRCRGSRRGRRCPSGSSASRPKGRPRRSGRRG